MKNWITLWLLLFPFIFYSQEPDSLISIIENTDDNDTNKIHALVDLAAIHYHDNLDTSRYLITKALILSEKQGFTRGIGFSNTAMSGYFFQKGDLDSALVYANKGAEILKSINDKQHILAAYNNMALIYNNMDKPAQAIEIYLKIFDLIKNREASVQHMAICNNLAIAYGNNHEPEQSKLWFEKVIAYATSMKSPMGLVYGFNGLSIVNMELNESDEAISNATKALNIGLENGMDKTVLESYQNIGKAYFLKKDYKKALKHLKQAEILAVKIGAKRNMEVVYEFTAQCYKNLDNYKAAFAYNELYHAIKDTIFKQEKVELIEELEKKYETAELKNKQTQLELEKQQYLQQMEIETLVKLQLQQEKEIATLKALKNEFYFYVSLVVTVILVAAGVIFFLLFRKKKQTQIKQLELNEQNKRLKVENQYKDAELKAIKAQLNPHFMFNALNSIQEYIILNEKELASDYLGKFADLMRLYLRQSNQNLIKIEDEIKSLHLYIELEALRQEDLTFAIKCEDEFLLEKKIPPMLIQPYVENAIKHGLWHKKEDKKLMILFYKKEELIICEVVDNGIGIEASKAINQQKSKHKSFSTDANANRIKIIQEKHGNRLNISIEELGDKNEVTGTKVTIEVPGNMV